MEESQARFSDKDSRKMRTKSALAHSVPDSLSLFLAGGYLKEDGFFLPVWLPAWASECES